ncbi:MAG: sugar phosphate isomerase/epimerase family protein [candidate division NC10 bacterium]
MKLGFVSLPSEGQIKFARETGFDGIEVALGRWMGEGNDMTPENGRKTKGVLDKHSVRALTVSLCENYAEDPNPAERMKKTLEVAQILGAKIVTVNAWIPKDLKVEEKFKYYKKVWTRFAEMAEDSGVRVAIENCPHGGLNLGNCPESFRRMFELVPSKAIGLEFDPSHFIFQFMDYLTAIHEFGDRIYAFHAKDTQILRDRLNRVGIYGDSWLGQGWWRFRMPGYGDADGKGIFVALSDIKYAGDIIIEHEDPTYAGEEGLRRGGKFLRQFML